MSCSLYTVDRNTLWLIAICESKLNPNAGNSDYGGIFRFSSSTWKTTRKAMGEEAILTAAYKIGDGGINAWKNCIP